MTSPAVRAARRHLQATLVDSCRIGRLSDPVFDPATGEYTRTEELVYEGPCRLIARDQEALISQFGEQAVSTVTAILTVPWNVDSIQLEDTVAVTASADPALEAQRWVVRDVGSSTLATSRRVVVEEART